MIDDNNNQISQPRKMRIGYLAGLIVILLLEIVWAKYLYYFHSSDSDLEIYSILLVRLFIVVVLPIVGAVFFVNSFNIQNRRGMLFLAVVLLISLEGSVAAISLQYIGGKATAEVNSNDKLVAEKIDAWISSSATKIITLKRGIRYPALDNSSVLVGVNNQKYYVFNYISGQFADSLKVPNSNSFALVSNRGQYVVVDGFTISEIKSNGESLSTELISMSDDRNYRISDDIEAAFSNDGQYLFARYKLLKFANFPHYLDNYLYSRGVDSVSEAPLYCILDIAQNKLLFVNEITWNGSWANKFPTSVVSGNPSWQLDENTNKCEDLPGQIWFNSARTGAFYTEGQPGGQMQARDTVQYFNTESCEQKTVFIPKSASLPDGGNIGKVNILPNGDILFDYSSNGRLSIIWTKLSGASKILSQVVVNDDDNILTTINP